MSAAVTHDGRKPAARVIAMPGAAVAPVVNPQRRGRLPRGVVRLSPEVRYKRDQARAGELAARQALQRGERITPVDAPCWTDERADRPACVAQALAWLEGQLQERPAMETPAALGAYLRLRIAHLPFEVFGCVFLDTQRGVIDCRELFRGTLSETSVYPREVARVALQLGAASLVLYHNHPSGNGTPSPADEFLTRRLRQALDLVGVAVVDHFVITQKAVVSFVERGLW